MSRISLLASAAVICLAAGSAASAADLPARPYTKAPMMAAPYNWTGFYAGVNAGYAFGRESSTLTGLGVAGTGSVDYDGLFGGGQIGYNIQYGMWVWGIEADIQGSSIGGRQNAIAAGLGAAAVSNKMDAFGTIRGRLGFAYDRFLPYVTGGFAVGRNTLTVGGAALEETATHTGWTVGAGIEHALRDGWTVKAEYLHVDLGSEDYLSAFAPLASASANMRLHIVRAGLNYRF
jgi:outer membrane immunogenic protein